MNLQCVELTRIPWLDAQDRNTTSISIQNPLKFIEIKAVFGDLAQQADFAKAYLIAIEKVRDKSIKQCIQEINA